MDSCRYLDKKIKNCARTDLFKTDHEIFKENGAAEFVLRRLMSKKFRKWKVGPEYAAELKASVDYAVNKQQPINTTWFFGGYKLHHFPSSPEVDWAEFFNICYLLNYISSIAELYKPGVIMTYWAAHPSIMKRQSNIPESSCLVYHYSFNRLLSGFIKYLPDNIKLELRCFSELYPVEKKYSEELEPLIEKIKKEYNDWPAERKNKKEATSKLNIQWRGAENWAALSAEEKREKIKMGPIVHDGYCRLSGVNKAIRGLGKVDLTATPLPKYNSITIGTTSASVTKFWTGFGVLEKTADSYVDRILSPRQFDSLRDKKHEVVKCDLIPLKNFNEICVYPKSFDFS